MWKSCLTWYVPGYQRCLLNKSRKFRICCWVLDPRKEHLLRGHCILLLSICLPQRPGFCHSSSPSDSPACDILWPPHHYLIGDSALAQENCPFFFNLQVSLAHLPFQYFFLSQTFPLVILSLIWYLSRPQEYEMLAPPCASRSLSTRPSCSFCHHDDFTLAPSLLSLSFKGNSSVIFPLLCPLSSFTTYNPASFWLSACLTITPAVYSCHLSLPLDLPCHLSSLELSVFYSKLFLFPSFFYFLSLFYFLFIF